MSRGDVESLPATTAVARDPVYMPLLKTTEVSNAGASSARSPAPAQAGAQHGDIIQFASKVFYVAESEGVAHLQVIRIGLLKEACTVKYHTRDASAEEGKKYHGCKGTLHFKPGEHSQAVDVRIVEDDAFDTTLEFNVVLTRPSNCKLDAEMQICRVLILDDDLFPSNKFEEQIHSTDDQALYNVGFHLLFSFISFCFTHIPGIRKKSLLMLLLDQLGNAYYLMTIFLRVYLVDVCLNFKDESTMDKLFIPGNRWYTALFLGALWVLPNIILTASDYFEMAVLEMGFNIRRHLRVNLFRKYLNYTVESRAQVPVQDLKTSMMEDIPDVVSNGYLILFELWRIFGKIVCVGFFMLRKDPKSAFPIVVYPLVMFIWIYGRFNRRMELLSKQGDGESETQGWLIHACNSNRLIADYRKRGFVVRKFEESLISQRKLTMDLKGFKFFNDLIIPWITTIAIGLYMGCAAKSVVDKELGLGSYLAMINVYKDLGDRFGGVYEGFSALTEAIDPLVGLTTQLNLATDLSLSKATHEMRDAWVKNMLTQQSADPTVPIYDQIPIAFRDVACEHSPSLKAGVSLQVPQGNVILIQGPHDSGKATIVKLLTDNSSSHRGAVCCPLHLRILHVGYHPMLISTMGLCENLTFGCMDNEAAVDVSRVRGILCRLGLDKPCIMEELENSLTEGMRQKSRASSSGGKSAAAASDSRSDSGGSSEDLSGNDVTIDFADAGGDDEDSKPSDGWHRHLSNSEVKRLSLARAFISNPEVMILNRPVDDLDHDVGEKVLGLMREFVDARGVEMDDAGFANRRPRTLFFSAGTTRRTAISDIVWNVGPTGLSVDRGDRRPPGAVFLGPGGAL